MVIDCLDTLDSRGFLVHESQNVPLSGIRICNGRIDEGGARTVVFFFFVCCWGDCWVSVDVVSLAALEV